MQKANKFYSVDTELWHRLYVLTGPDGRPDRLGCIEEGRSLFPKDFFVCVLSPYNEKEKS